MSREPAPGFCQRTNELWQAPNNTPRCQKHGEKPSIEHDDVNRLHGRYPLRRRNARQSLHNEIRKSEKDSSHKTRAECCDKRQEVDRIIHLSKSAGAFSDAVFIMRIES